MMSSLRGMSGHAEHISAAFVAAYIHGAAAAAAAAPADTLHHWMSGSFPASSHCC